MTINAIKARHIAASAVSLVLTVFMATITVGCHKRLGPTTIEVDDSVRHYPAVVLGDDLPMVFTLRNTGKETLVLTDVQPSCPTIEMSVANTNTVPPGEEALLKFVYHADKNIGLARHSIRLFGNIAPHGVAELIFDTHVVRPSVDLSDHEEFYQNELRSTEEHMLDDDNADRGYNKDE